MPENGLLRYLTFGYYSMNDAWMMQIISAVGFLALDTNNNDTRNGKDIKTDRSWLRGEDVRSQFS